MSADESRHLYFLVDGDRSAFSIHASASWDINDLKKAIICEAGLGLKTSDVILMRLQHPIIIKPVQTLIDRLPSSIPDSSVVLKEPTDAVSDFFPRSLAKGHLHIIVLRVPLSRPVTSPASISPSSSAESNRSDYNAERQKLEVDPWNIYVSREETVSALYEKLERRRWVHVRGTPGSGKSVLAGLLRRYINEKEPDTKVVFVDAWPENRPVQTTPDTILILNEAQTTYWDKNFWSKFKNPGLQDMRVVAFASHDSSDYTEADNGMPIWIGLELRVGLARLDCGDGIVVGLLFTREEFNALVQLRFRDTHFSDSFLDCVFDMTNGHVGACEDLMKTVIAHKSYHQRAKAAEYTYEMFITDVSMTYIVQSIYRTTVFARGLPDADSDLRDNPNITALLREVIRKESIVFPDKYLVSDPKDDDNRKAALRKIFRSGVLYTFASPLHRRCIDWIVNGLPLESGITESNLLEFALTVIRKFSRQSLDKREIGPKAQSILEAQIQDEFYSASSKQANGSISFPEFGTKKGRIDFFIRLKKWGVELLCDGKRLGQHARRFTEGEYGKWIEKGWMEDYIIIDFRTRRPMHPDVDRLIYVVSVDDWNTIEVLDNEGGVLGQYSLLDNS